MHGSRPAFLTHVPDAGHKKVICVFISVKCLPACKKQCANFATVITDSHPACKKRPHGTIGHKNPSLSGRKQRPRDTYTSQETVNIYREKKEWFRFRFRFWNEGNGGRPHRRAAPVCHACGQISRPAPCAQPARPAAHVEAIA